jgi:hypothetical protein
MAQKYLVNNPEEKKPGKDVKSEENNSTSTDKSNTTAASDDNNTLSVGPNSVSMSGIASAYKQQVQSPQ